MNREEIREIFEKQLMNKLSVETCGDWKNREREGFCYENDVNGDKAYQRSDITDRWIGFLEAWQTQEQTIKELREEIESLKCCGNCGEDMDACEFCIRDESNENEGRFLKDHWIKR